MLRMSAVVGVLVVSRRICWAGHETGVLVVDGRMNRRAHAWRSHRRSHHRSCENSVNMNSCRIDGGSCSGNDARSKSFRVNTQNELPKESTLDNETLLLSIGSTDLAWLDRYIFGMRL